MGLNNGILLVALVFFGLLLFSVHREDHRAKERRQQDQVPPVERRRGDRRKKRLGVALQWAWKAAWSRRKP